MTNPDDERTLDDWAQKLTQALQILDLKIDRDLLLRLAARSSDVILPEAGALSTFVVGYAAGRASTTGEREAVDAVRTAAETAMLVVEHDMQEKEEENPSWSQSAQ